MDMVWPNSPKGSSRRLVSLTTAVALFAVGLVVALAPVASAQSLPTLDDVRIRDQLIASQETLLNAYRCLFDVDTEVVSGGCPDFNPTRPVPFDGVPSREAVDVRDQLIETQEALLNAYRCLFDIDTHIVPGGCPDATVPGSQGTADPTPSESARPFTSLAAGNNHSCAIRADQTLVCWGDGTYGQTNAPAGQYVAVSAGDLYSCAIRADNGTVECWGYTGGGAASPPGGQFTSLVSSAKSYNCGFRPSGAIECWGRDDFGETSPTGQFTSISLGTDHACGIATDGTADCWGRNKDSHGLMYAIMGGSRTISDFAADCGGGSGACGAGRASPPAGQFTAVAAGRWHACGLGASGVVACWGSNRKRVGSFGSSRTAVVGQANPPSGQFKAIAAGQWHTCGIKADETISCWGDNGHGQTDAPNGRFTSITVGYDHTCGFRADGTIACWGWNDGGQASPPVA